LDGALRIAGAFAYSGLFMGDEMALPRGYASLKGSTHPHPAGHKKLRASKASEVITVTLILKRRAGAQKPKELKDFSPASRASQVAVSRANVGAELGADPADLKKSKILRMLTAFKWSTATRREEASFCGDRSRR
jgi:hypothetical protein